MVQGSRDGVVPRLIVFL